MQSHDPRIDPKTANVFDHDADLAYSRRSFRAIVGLAIGLIGAGLFAGWFFFGGADETENPDVIVAEQKVIEGEDLPQMPGNEYAEDTGRSAVYDFFYRMFGGIEDGLEDSPHNLDNVEQIDDLNINTAEIFDDAAPNALLDETAPSLSEPKERNEYQNSLFDAVGSAVINAEGKSIGKIYDVLIHKDTGAGKAIIVREDKQLYERPLSALNFEKVRAEQDNGEVILNVATEKIDSAPKRYSPEQTDEDHVSLRLLREGKVLDFEGNVSGEIDAVIHQNAEAQSVYFELQPDLAELGPEKFKLDFKDVNIVKSAQGLHIQLNEKQTRALADYYFKE